MRRGCTPPLGNAADDNRRSYPRCRFSLLAQLAILAASAVVASECGFLLVALALAGHAQAYARHGFASCFGNLCVAFLAALQARTFWRLTAGAFDRVINRRVDLILYSAVTGPTGCHGR